ncbi:MAG: nucleotidyltransferase domain-containing protein [Candidatus Acidiferrales bacterium]
MNFDRVSDFLRALEQESVEYVLVGGVAINLNGITRGTQDVDIVIRLDEHKVERPNRALRRVWNDPAINEIRYDDLAGEYPAITYGPPGEVFGIDILTRFGEVFRYEDLQATIIEWQGVKVQLATPQTLYRMKKDTVRND